jgi:hypothetical protein
MRATYALILLAGVMFALILSVTMCRMLLPGRSAGASASRGR